MPEVSIATFIGGVLIGFWLAIIIGQYMIRKGRINRLMRFMEIKKSFAEIEANEPDKKTPNK